MFNIFYIAILLVCSTNANYHGPFLLWGHDNLKQGDLPALETINERSLTLMYSEAKAIILFVRNGTSKLNKENFPNFSSLIIQNKWAYLPQENLPAEPVDFNSNVEVITLVGPASQQDVELGALYKDAVSIYGEGKVLGILSTQAEDSHFMYKRETDEDKSDKKENKKGKKDRKNNEEEVEEEEETEEEQIDDHIYIAKDKKGILYTTGDPVLNLEINDKIESFNLTEHGDVMSDERENFTRLVINFKIDNTKLFVRLRFPTSRGYWELNEAEIEFRETKVSLPLIGKSPSAPIGFSYKCAQGELLFQNGSNSLILRDYQVEPLTRVAGKFSDAYDCVGFISAPIWSGVLVSAFLVGVTFVGILAIMDIKTPNRFESSRSKQLTFTVQE